MSAPRQPHIDALKVAASQLIVWHHLAAYGPVADTLHAAWPAWMDWLYDYGRMAVQVFLVLGGYLALPGLLHTLHAPWPVLLGAMAGRYRRLAPPFLIAMLLAAATGTLTRPWLGADLAGDPVTAAQVLAHALLLHDVLGQASLSAGVWYVAIDFQLFALTVLMLAGVRALPMRQLRHQAAAVSQGLVLLMAGASLWLFNRMAGLDMWALYFFGAYGLGMLAYWATRAPQAQGWMTMMALLAGVALAVDFRARIAVAAVTALCLVVAMRSDRVRSFTGVSPLVQLGQMSYSVFLVHFAVCLLVNAVVSHLWPTSPVLNALGMLLAFALSLVAGRLLYLRVERHVPSWSTALRWQLGLVGAGMLVVITSNWA